MENELREFVYLDEMSVNSLLASQYIAVPEAVKDATEDIEMDGSGLSLGGSVSVPGIGSLEGGGETSSSDESRNLREIERKVNGQYRFSLLHDVLEKEDLLKKLSRSNGNSGLNLNAGQPIKIQGRCDPDPFFNLLNSITILLRMFEASAVEQNMNADWDLTEQKDEIMVDGTDSVFDIWKRVLHGERIGLRIDSDNFDYPVVMSIDLNSLWTDPKREFFSTKNYTVVGRVDEVISKSNWDYIDLLQIMGQVFSEDSVDEFRGNLMDLAEDLKNQENQEDSFDFDVEIDRSDYVVEGPAIIVDPIAIYW